MKTELIRLYKMIRKANQPITAEKAFRLAKDMYSFNNYMDGFNSPFA